MRNEAGYTLVELVIVLALLGLISLAIAGGFSFGTRVWERTEQEVARTETARFGHALLSSLIGRIYPRSASEGAAAAFQGAPTRMSFLADASAAFGNGGVARFELSTEPDGTLTALRLTHHPELGAQTSQTETILSGASAIRFAYAELNGGAIVWLDSWDGKPGLPALIRVRASFPPGGMSWPDLIVRPEIDRAANCVYDPVSFECRHG